MSFLVLPNELLLDIVGRLDLRSRKQLRRADRRLYALATPDLYRSLTFDITGTTLLDSRIRPSGVAHLSGITKDLTLLFHGNPVNVIPSHSWARVLKKNNLKDQCIRDNYENFFQGLHSLYVRLSTRNRLSQININPTGPARSQNYLHAAANLKSLSIGISLGPSPLKLSSSFLNPACWPALENLVTPVYH